MCRCSCSCARMLENKIIIFVLITIFEPSFKCLTTVPKNERDTNLQVRMSNGVLQGKKILSGVKNKSYYAFFGIPYAQPPTGNLRFRPPQPVLNWTGILDARTEGSECAQRLEGSEDCLFINVYTPYMKKLQARRSLLPVMVWIHGGGFMMGSSNYTNQGPDYLIQHGVVVAAFNYRLGVFGFLNTGDMTSPGNYGLKDQIEALKWVQRNIRHFGGNPSEVTIFGESAGGASVHYLLQTPLANGLFHRAISESGTTLCNWSFTREPKKIAFKIAEAAGVTATNTEELVRKMRLVDYDLLDTATTALIFEEIGNIYDDGIIFSPSIEPEHEDAVVSKASHVLLSSNQFNKVPCLIGFNSQESAGVGQAMGIVRSAAAENDAEPTTVVHQNMNIFNLETKVKVANAIRSFYFGNSSVATAPEDLIFDFLSDDVFLRPIHETVKLHSQSVPVYFYRFSYESPHIGSGDNRTVKGVSHAEELRYIFYKRGNTQTNGDVSITSKMVKMWTNFAKTGNPTPTREKLLNNVIWPVASSAKKENGLSFLDINNRLVPGVNPREEAMEFWDDLYQKYGRPPFDTY